MKIYVAGKTNDWARVRRVQEICIRLGHTISYDWTKTVEEVGADACSDGTVTDAFRRQCAERDVGGVVDADTLIMCSYPGLCGTLIEVGMALMRSIPVIVIGEPERNSVFFTLPKVTMIQEENDLIDTLPTPYLHR